MVLVLLVLLLVLTMMAGIMSTEREDDAKNLVMGRERQWYGIVGHGTPQQQKCMPEQAHTSKNNYFTSSCPHQRLRQEDTFDIILA